MFTSQMIVNGTVKPKEIVRAFGVPLITVKRYVKVFRERGTEGFYMAKPRHSSASVLKGEVLRASAAITGRGAERTGSSAGAAGVGEHGAQGDPRRAIAQGSKKTHRPLWR